MLAHQLAGFDGHEEVTADVDVDGLLERAQVGVQHVAEVGVGRSVVDQDVQLAELFFDGGDGGDDLVHVTDVAGLGRSLAARCNDGVGDCLAVFDLTAGDDHVRTLLGQQLGDGFADAAAGAGYQSYFAVEVEQLGLLHGLILDLVLPPCRGAD